VFSRYNSRLGFQESVSPNPANGLPMRTRRTQFNDKIIVVGPRDFKRSLQKCAGQLKIGFSEQVRSLLDYGKVPENKPYTNQEIADLQARAQIVETLLDMNA
jgi:hypothetical protein